MSLVVDKQLSARGMALDRRQETEARSQKTGDRRQEAGDRSQKAEGRRQETGELTALRKQESITWLFS